MEKIHIIFFGFLENDRKTLSVGGVQTYIYNLCGVIRSIGFDPIVYQPADEYFETEYQGIKVIGVKGTNNNFSKRAIKKISKGEIVIFASEEFSCKYEGEIITIQHGIYWDRPKHYGWSKQLNHLFVLWRSLLAYKKVKQIDYARKVICVDYNFINWYRSQVAYPNVQLVAIPNFAKPADGLVKDKNSNAVKIIFARRFVEFRGTRVFQTAILRLLKEYGSRIDVTFAGSGPDESFLRETFKKYENVHFIRYKNEESLTIHSEMDIAVIPTVGSEGTSLSLLEAMSSGCAVVCTDVGGMTNIVLNNYNGLMIPANDANELYNSMKYLIDNKDKRISLAEKAIETTQKVFSYERWKNLWERELLESVKHKMERDQL